MNPTIEGLPTAVDWAVLPPPSPWLEVTVIVPVRNEADELHSTLAALEAQCTLDGRPFDKRSFEVLLLCNNCTDASAEVARHWALAHPELALHVVEATFPPQVAHVGHARRLLMDEACRRLRTTVGDHGVIASTDGDTCVAPTWLAATIDEIDAGADAVGGRIHGISRGTLPAALRRMERLDTAYHLLRTRLESQIDPDPADPWPKHHQHFGASLAITVKAYVAVGALPVVPYLEDQALVNLLRRADLRVRHSCRVRVATSNRFDGRVEVGLSGQLKIWAAMLERDEPVMVEPVEPWLAIVALRHRLRLDWTRRRSGCHSLADRSLAQHLGVHPGWLVEQTAMAQTFGELWEIVERRSHELSDEPVLAKVPLNDALRVMREQVRRNACTEAANRRAAAKH